MFFFKTSALLALTLSSLPTSFAADGAKLAPGLYRRFDPARPKFAGMPAKPDISKRLLSPLIKRQYNCNSPDVYCNDPSFGCCDNGDCAPLDAGCCEVSGYCPKGDVCCEGGCNPGGTNCCADGGYCPSGQLCVTCDIGICCDGGGSVEGGGGGGGSQNTITYYSTYYFTYTYYYYYYWTYAATEYTTTYYRTTTYSLSASDSYAATSQFDALTATFEYPSTTGTPPPGATSGASPTFSLPNLTALGGGGGSGGSQQTGGSSNGGFSGGGGSGGANAGSLARDLPSLAVLAGAAVVALLPGVVAVLL